MGVPPILRAELVCGLRAITSYQLSILMTVPFCYLIDDLHTDLFIAAVPVFCFGPLLRSLHNLSVNFTVGDSL